VRYTGRQACNKFHSKSFRSLDAPSPASHLDRLIWNYPQWQLLYTGLRKFEPTIVRIVCPTIRRVSKVRTVYLRTLVFVRHRRSDSVGIVQWLV
jgi:hypothetical protein